MNTTRYEIQITNYHTYKAVDYPGFSMRERNTIPNSFATEAEAYAFISANRFGIFASVTPKAVTVKPA